MRVVSLTLLAVAALSGCGTPGAPLPPSLGIPKPVSDLQAVRKGDTVTLTWPAPRETTDGELIRKPGKMEVSRIVAGRAQVITELPLAPALKRRQAPAAGARDSLAGLLQSPAADFAEYSVLAANHSGQTAGPSLRASVALVPVAAAPQTVQAVAVPQGIRLTWEQAWPPQNKTRLSAQYAYRIMRRVQGTTAPVMVAQANMSNEAMAFIDTGIEWQKHYDYWITPVTLWQGSLVKGEVEGDDSPVVSVFANDIFPPAVPANLQAVFSGLPQQPFIDLTWTPDTEPDLAGYNVYRRAGNETPVKVNADLVKTPSFRDMNVKAGIRYFYSVSAVDVRKNESGRSKEASETVPQE